MISFLFLKNSKITDEKGHRLQLSDVQFDERGKITSFVFKTIIGKKDTTQYFAAVDVRQGAVFARNEREEKEEPRTAPIKEVLSAGKHLLSAAVVTESGMDLGKVSDMELDPQINSIENIAVNKHFWERIFHSPLYINSAQIAEFQKKKVVVKDAFLKEFALSWPKAAV